MKNKNLALKLTESAMMIALATILSFLKLANLPYGGSITIASMLPILVVAVRYGVPWGLFTGLVHGTLQFIIDPSPLSYFSDAKSIVAIVVLDYLLAFSFIGLGGVVRKIKNPAASLTVGAVIAGVIRYICHVISGATVWAGLSIPTSAALIYSFIYNATYMLPETLVLVCAAYFIATSVDFRSQRLAPAKRGERRVSAFKVISVAAFMAALIYDIAAVFDKLQNAETGEFDITGIAEVNWMVVAIVTAVGVAVSLVMVLVERYTKPSKAEKLIM